MSCGTKRPLPAESEDATESDDHVDDMETTETTAKRRGSTRNWQASWEKQFPWLERQVGPSGEVLAVCCWCCKGGKKNAFSSGSTNLKASAFTRHETRNVDHTEQVLARYARLKNATVDAAMRRLCEQEVRKAVDGNLALEVQLRTMYSIVKSGQPINEFNTACELQTLNRTPGWLSYM